MLTVLEYATRFHSLSRFAPELVPMEDKKCRRFEKGLHSPVKRLVMSNRVGKFSEIVECARGLELIKDEMRGTKAWDPRQPAMSLSSSLGSYGSQGPKGKPFQSPQNQ